MRADKPEYAVKFEPSNGLIHVGDRTIFKCILDSTNASAHRSTDRAVFQMTDLNDRVDLLSTQSGSESGLVTPPQPDSGYTTVGSTTVQCDYKIEGTSVATTQLNVHILRELHHVNHGTHLFR